MKENAYLCCHDYKDFKFKLVKKKFDTRNSQICWGNWVTLYFKYQMLKMADHSSNEYVLLYELDYVKRVVIQLLLVSLS